MAQKQPTPQQIDAAQRILSHDHKRVYSQGAKGTTIRAMQIFLASQGYEPGRFDGDFGDKTQAAYDKFMRANGQTWGSVTPKSLAFMSKIAGQPLPRQRPAQPGDALPAPADNGVNLTGSTQSVVGSGGVVPMMGDLTPPPVTTPDNIPPDASQAQEHEYDPNVLHAAVMNRNEPPDMAAQVQPPDVGNPSFGALPVMPATDNSGLGNLMQTMGMDNGIDKIAAAQGMAPRGFDASRFNETAPMTSDQGVPDNLMESLRTTPPDALRAALMASSQFSGRPSYPAPNTMNPLEALRQALLAAPRVAGR